MENENTTLITVATSPAGTMFSAKEVAQVFRISTETVRKLIEEEDLVAVKLTGNFRILRESIIDYVKKASPKAWETTKQTILGPMESATQKARSEEGQDFVELELAWKAMEEHLKW